jgi:quinol monooxygenase YgiN
MTTTSTIEPGTTVATLINVFTVRPERQAELVDLLARATEESIRHRPGFISANIHASADGERVVNYAQWASEDTLRATLADPAAREQAAAVSQVAEAADLRLYTVASIHHT